MANLLSHHDFYHIHAVCGFIGLLHFLYRVYLMLLDVENAGLGRSLGEDLVSMLILVLPNSTSYLIAIVNVKKGNDGFSIWKEYRGHSFVYNFKMWLYVALRLYAKHFLPTQELEYDQFYRYFLEFATMFGLQYVTQQYPRQESTIRGMYKTPLAVFIAGFLQFMARAAMFFGPPDIDDFIAALVMGMLVVQLNAFNMTLRKKRIIGPKTTQTVYSSLLASALYMFLLRRLWAKPPIGIFDPRFKFICLGLIAYGCRRQGFDRYSSWIVALSTMGFVDQQIGLFQTEY